MLLLLLRLLGDAAAAATAASATAARAALTGRRCRRLLPILRLSRERQQGSQGGCCLQGASAWRPKRGSLSGALGLTVAQRRVVSRSGKVSRRWRRRRGARPHLDPAVLYVVCLEGEEWPGGHFSSISEENQPEYCRRN